MSSDRDDSRLGGAGPVEDRVDEDYTGELAWATRRLPGTWVTRVVPRTPRRRRRKRRRERTRTSRAPAPIPLPVRVPAPRTPGPTALPGPLLPVRTRARTRVLPPMPARVRRGPLPVCRRCLCRPPSRRGRLRPSRRFPCRARRRPRPPLSPRVTGRRRLLLSRSRTPSRCGMPRPGPRRRPVGVSPLSAAGARAARPTPLCGSPPPRCAGRSRNGRPATGGRRRASRPKPLLLRSSRPAPRRRKRRCRARSRPGPRLLPTRIPSPSLPPPPPPLNRRKRNLRTNRPRRAPRSGCRCLVRPRRTPWAPARRAALSRRFPRTSSARTRRTLLPTTRAARTGPNRNRATASRPWRLSTPADPIRPHLRRRRASHRRPARPPHLHRTCTPAAEPARTPAPAQLPAAHPRSRTPWRPDPHRRDTASRLPPMRPWRLCIPVAESAPRPRHRRASRRPPATHHTPGSTHAPGRPEPARTSGVRIPARGASPSRWTQPTRTPGTAELPTADRRSRRTPRRTHAPGWSEPARTRAVRERGLRERRFRGSRRQPGSR